jgi:chromosome segregation ATPase
VKQVTGSLEEERIWVQELENERDQFREQLDVETHLREKQDKDRVQSIEELHEETKELREEVKELKEQLFKYNYYILRHSTFIATTLHNMLLLLLLKLVKMLCLIMLDI